MPIADTNTANDTISVVERKEDFKTDWDHIVNKDGSVSQVRLTQKTRPLEEAECVLSQYPPARIGASMKFGHCSVPAGHSIVTPSESCKTGYRRHGKEVGYIWEVEPSLREASTIAPKNITVSHLVNHFYAGTQCETRTIDRYA